MKRKRNGNEPSEYANMNKEHFEAELEWRFDFRKKMKGARFCNLYIFSPAFAAIGFSDLSSGDAIGSIEYFALSLLALGAVKASNYVRGRLEHDINYIESARNNLEGRTEGGK